MFGWLNRYSARTYALLGEITLVVIGPALVAIDITYRYNWVVRLRMADFYAYLSLSGIISLYSLFGIYATVTRWVRGVTIYTIGLSLLMLVQTVIGLVHIVVLSLHYHDNLMHWCVQSQPSYIFWWNLGYEDNTELTRAYHYCEGQWSHFAAQRIISWALFSFLSTLSLLAIQRYHRLVKVSSPEPTLNISEQDRWSSEEKLTGKMKSLAAKAFRRGGTYKKGRCDEEEAAECEREKNRTPPPPAYSPTLEESKRQEEELYQHRQRLYAEITKSRRAQEAQQRTSIAETSANSEGKRVSAATPSSPSNPLLNTVHPLDIAGPTTHDETYVPPDSIPPPVEAGTSWYPAPAHAPASTEESAAALRDGRKGSNVSSEKLDYDQYRASVAGGRRSLRPTSLEMTMSPQQDLTTSDGELPKSRRRSKKNKRTSVADNPILLAGGKNWTPQDSIHPTSPGPSQEGADHHA
ncbi:uncharacterized protein BYT42DRAFT_546563 [Radiomyces spectabilis]|uniref:uncharacterized protein n=1 Tax=Radiomyces spectabilis TaxID=64574 RepID=UPI00221ED1E2|nr:uncharacterized protein BYT42DRAFT_546563 [Radiomyces spectabilis]KAI8377959.1 hypothetical protein BYT42DRAFT_546563 [Radiomyces spectabilis]